MLAERSEGVDVEDDPGPLRHEGQQAADEAGGPLGVVQAWAEAEHLRGGHQVGESVDRGGLDAAAAGSLGQRHDERLGQSDPPGTELDAAGQ